MAEYDQRGYWNRIHQEERLDDYPLELSEFALQTAKLLPDRARILELGCGVGADTAFFARAGHAVTATDFSEVAIERNRQRYSGQRDLLFMIVDLSEPLPFPGAEFDLVYARLSLHYFRDGLTRQIFGEVWRVLKPEGLLCFMCRSVEDPLYGRGERIEPDMFIHEGHVRHFFSEDYVRSCLGPAYRLDAIASDEASLYGRRSAVVRVVARKLPRG